MSYLSHTNIHQIRQVERGNDTSIDSVVQIDTKPSSAFALRRRPPTRKYLLRTLPPSSSPSLELLEWGTAATTHESSGLPGLGEFISSIRWPVHCPSLAPPVIKRRRSIDESEPPADSFSTKRVRLRQVNSEISERSAGSSPSSSSRPLAPFIQRRPAFRLGLRKRPAVGQQRAPGASSNAKTSLKRQLGPGPPRILAADEEPDNVFTSTSFSKIPRPNPQTPKDVRKGVVLVPSSQSPDVIAPPSDRAGWSHGRMAESVSYDTSPDTSPDRTSHSRLVFRRLALHDATKVSNIPENILSDRNEEECASESMASVGSRELSFDIERRVRSPNLPDSIDERTAGNDKDINDPRFSPSERKNNRPIASVMYDSSQGSTSSHSAEHSKLHTSYGSIELPSSFDEQFLSQKSNASESWNLSQPQADLTSLSKLASEPPAVSVSIVSQGSRAITGLPNAEEFPTGLSVISALYDSSQDHSSLVGSQELSLSRHEPIPSWSTYKSSQTSTFRPLSGARPSNSWSIPSVEGLVAASRSLSLEDFENQLRGSSGNGLVIADEQPRPEKSLSHSQPGRDVTKSINHATSLMHPEVSRLASYLSTEDSIDSSTPSLPQPLKHAVDDDSIESANSQLPTQIPPRNVEIDRVPAFRIPRSEPEEDISFESQQLQNHRAPTQSINPDSPLEVIDSSTSDQRISVPRFDAPPTPGRRSPRAVASAVTPEIIPAQKPSYSVILSAPDQQTPLNPPSPGSAAPFVLPNSKIYKGGLHKIIPEPHLLPSLSGPIPPLAEGMLAALEASSVHAWFDEDAKPTHPLEGFPRDPWKRAAWVIPVRGRPPWEGCSSAAISSRPIVKTRKKRTILWTPAALRSLWSQLDGFRQSKRVGFLSLSFEPVRADSQDHAFEFIKVYHDAKVSLKLRTILKVLEFRDRDGCGIDAGVPQEEDDLGLAGARRLLGSTTRLALVDEVGRIMLIS
ncbi:E3 ubiquitin-protein ligase MYCBP2 [Ceratobasidium sp. AG-Ba]|nr:E3 ubiquitin-protein ligase MYCBP2 [Ceratobasidium sp. AG-Ba]